MTKQVAIKTIIKPYNISTKNDIAQQWQTLEQSADASVFLSWYWISPWLDLVKKPIFLVVSYHENKVVGLAFFVEHHRKVFGVYTVKQWWLHRTGDTGADQIWIEHNDFLLDSVNSGSTRDSMIKAIMAYDATIKELVVGLSTNIVLTAFKLHFSGYNNLITTSGYVTKNTEKSTLGNEFTQTVLSKNTRSQLNRSNKLLAQQGEMKYCVITEKSQVLALLAKIANLHIELWHNEHDGSGFSNALFTHFHQTLIDEGNTLDDNFTNIVQISVLSCCDNELGYLLNFVYGGKVYFYLSAIKKHNNNKIKVGLALHSKAIQYYINQGIYSYDFLGGEARYKKSLSNQCYDLNMYSFHRNDTIFKCERFLKKIKQFISKK